MFKFHLKRAQKRMKSIADKGRSDKVFKVSDLVYLKLQPYRQHPLKRRINQNLSHCYFVPYLVIARRGQVAYTLDLPEGACIHPTFHVSQVKKHIGSLPKSTTLSPTDLNGSITKTPIRIVDRRRVKCGNHDDIEVLVEWANTFPKDST